MNNIFIYQYALKWDFFLHIYLNGWGWNSANPKDMFGVNHLDLHIYDHFEIKNTVLNIFIDICSNKLKGLILVLGALVWIHEM